MLQVFSELVASKPWSDRFDGFHNPYFFYSDGEYALWLEEAGFKVEQLALVPKDMTHHGQEGLAGWIRTTWMPSTHRVPESEREQFIADFVERYLALIPLDSDGLARVRMVRLEVNALKP